MSLRAKPLTAQQAAEVWAEFFEAYGPEVMAAAYGWDSPTARQRRKHERVWEFHDTYHGHPMGDGPDGRFSGRVGWGVCKLDRSDPDADTATFVVGVFPEHRGRGYRLQIFDWMAEWAKKQGAKYAEIIVFKDNEVHYERTLDEAVNKIGPWIHAGDRWFPEPGYGVFVRPLDEEAA